MNTDLVLLAVFMGLATYPMRAIPLLVPGVERLPQRATAYLRLVAPAVLAALAAVNVMVALDANRVPSFHVGVEWLAVLVCGALVAARRSLLLGLLLAAGLVALLRATSVAALP
ncbi:MAG: AzlD domain-containing protein [Chloroflexota bacterium]